MKWVKVSTRKGDYFEGSVANSGQISDRRGKKTCNQGAGVTDRSSLYPTWIYFFILLFFLSSACSDGDDLAGPSPPAGVSAEAGDGQVTLTWNDVPGADGYTIYRSTQSGVTKENFEGPKVTDTASPFVQTGLTNLTTYYFVITSFNGAGESGESQQVSATPSAPLPVSSVSAGGSHSIALREDGTVWTWGDNGAGQLGDGTATRRTAPVIVSGLIEFDANGQIVAVTQVEGGSGHTLALKQGRVWAWGMNTVGQLGDGTTTNRPEPVRVLGLENVTSISAGEFHSVALRNDGTVWSWGGNSSGQLGNNSAVDSAIPVQVCRLSGATCAPLTGIVAVSAGGQHSAALTGAGEVFTWGSNNRFQLGDSSSLHRLAPVNPVAGLAAPIAAIAAGGFHTLALLTDGTVWAWGGNSSGELGDNTTTSRLTPAAVTGLSGVTRIAAGGSHSLAVRSDQTLWAWGYNVWGQVGNNIPINQGNPGGPLNQTTPVQAGGLMFTEVKQVDGGGLHTIAVKEDGSVWTWGFNFLGQLGVGTTVDHSTPVPVTELAR